ncbi:hypothetical protein Tco_0160876, partial [Tanacetum coccineum]
MRVRLQTDHLLPNPYPFLLTQVKTNLRHRLPFSRPSPSIVVPDPEGFGGNHGGQSSNDASLSGNEDDLTLQSVYDLYLSLCTQVTTQAAEIKALKAQVKKLKKQARPFILHHKAWLRAIKRKKQQKEKVLKTSKQRRSVSKLGRRTVKSSSKGAPSVPTNTEWNAIDMEIDETMDYTLAQDMESAEKKASSEGTANQDEGKSVTQTPTSTPTPTTPTPTVFGDD